MATRSSGGADTPPESAGQGEDSAVLVSKMRLTIPPGGGITTSEPKVQPAVGLKGGASSCKYAASQTEGSKGVGRSPLPKEYKDAANKISQLDSTQAPADHSLKLAHAGNKEFTSIQAARQVGASRIRCRESLSRLKIHKAHESARGHVRSARKGGQRRRYGTGAVCLRLRCAACSDRV
eukprot:6191523-Pleurochrysis_carterae.AAC.2